MLLDMIKDADDIKKIDEKDYPRLAKEIRKFLVEKTSETGGHLASNLGTVELTMALFLSLDMPKDKVIWDVGHQTYTHKILSGRKEGFDGLRQFGGMAGFPKTKESEYDAFNTGHSSTSISAALGMAMARDLKGEDYTVAAVIGDGSLTGGMAYEALNNAAQMKNNFIIILNDNNMSISHNVGGMSRYLNGIRTGSGYISLKKNVADALEKIPAVGPKAIDKIKRTKNSIKQMFIPGMLFEDMGITYLGPVDGHDVMALKRVINDAKKLDHAVLIHVKTIKGKGYGPAQLHPEEFHGVGPFDVKTGKPKKEKTAPDYTDVFSEALCELAEKDERILAITAAMPEGTGLKTFGERFPRRFFDVGIAEAHAVTAAAGMAAGGMIPVVAVYSSFLQRGFDQIIHDVCIQNLHVIFAIDRAGLVGADGETHQGIFDLSYLSMIPNMTVMAPKNAPELKEMLALAARMEGPVAIRYPRGTAYTGLTDHTMPLETGRGEILFEESEIAILAAGSMVSTGEHVRNKLKEKGHRCSLVNMRFIKPMDEELVDKMCENHRLIITMEENVLNGGFGLKVSSRIQEQGRTDVRVCHVALPDAYVEHGNVSLLRQMLGIDSDSIMKKLEEEYGI